MILYWMWGDKPMSHEVHDSINMYAQMRAISASGQATEFFIKSDSWWKYFSYQILSGSWELEHVSWPTDNDVPAIFRTLNMIGV